MIRMRVVLLGYGFVFYDATIDYRSIIDAGSNQLVRGNGLTEKTFENDSQWTYVSFGNTWFRVKL